MPPSVIGAAFKKLARRKPREHSEGLTSKNVCVLPTSVYEIIIDYAAGQQRDSSKLWLDPRTVPTLRACSLTCRSWTPRAQHHLFTFLRVRCSHKYTKKALGLLERNPALQSRIEVLVLGPGGRNGRLGTVPLKLAKAMSQIPELRISQATVDHTTTSSSESSLSILTAVTTLNLFCCTFQSAHDLRRVICSLSTLKTLIVEWPQWTRSKPDRELLPQIATQNVPRLQSLSFNTSLGWQVRYSSFRFLGWLAMSGAVQSLTSLMLMDVVAPDRGVMLCLGQIIRASAGTLEQLSFSIPSFMPDNPRKQPMLRFRWLRLTPLHNSLPRDRTMS